MDYFTQEDHDWLKAVQKFPNKYRVIVDDDLVGVEDIAKDEYVHTFNLHGCEFIHALLNDIGVTVAFC